MTAISRDAASRFPERDPIDRFASGVASGDPSASFDLLLAPPTSPARASRPSEGNDDRRESELRGRAERRSRSDRPDRSDESLRPRIEPSRRTETRPTEGSTDPVSADSATTTDRSASLGATEPVTDEAESTDEAVSETVSDDGASGSIATTVTSVAPIETLPESSADLDELEASTLATSVLPNDSAPKADASGESRESIESEAVEAIDETVEVPLVAPASTSADVVDESEPPASQDEAARSVTAVPNSLVVPRRGSRPSDERGRSGTAPANETLQRPIADHLQHLDRSGSGGRSSTAAVEAAVLSSTTPVPATTDADAEGTEPTGAIDAAGSRRTDFVSALSDVFGIEPTTTVNPNDPTSATESIDATSLAIEGGSEIGATRPESPQPIAPSAPSTTDARAVPIPAATTPSVGIAPPRTEGADGVRARYGIDPVEHRRFLHRVGRAFEAAEARGGEIRMRLSPPRLGGLSLEVRLDGDKLAARVETETEAARQLILEQLPVLRERLAERGISIEQFDVDLFRETPGDGGSPREERSGDDGASRRRSLPTSETNRDGERVVCRPFGGADGRGIDVTI